MKRLGVLSPRVRENRKAGIAIEAWSQTVTVEWM